MTAEPTGLPIRRVSGQEVNALLGGDQDGFAELREDLLREFHTGARALLLRGFDLDRLGESQFAQCLKRMGAWLGEASPQSPAGDLIARVESNKSDLQARGTHSDSELDPHADMHDILALACVRAAEHGGESFLVDADRLYARLAAEALEHLPALLGGYYFGTNPVLRSEHRVSEARVPIFLPAGDGGGMHCCCNGYFLRMAAASRGEELPGDLGAALQVLQTIAAEMAAQNRFRLEPGDVLFWHNWSWLHGRTAFADGSSPPRLLLRLWLRSAIVARHPLLAQRGVWIDEDHALTQKLGLLAA